MDLAFEVCISNERIANDATFSILVFVDLAFEDRSPLNVMPDEDRFSILVFVDLAFEEHDGDMPRQVDLFFQSLFSWI